MAREGDSPCAYGSGDHALSGQIGVAPPLAVGRPASLSFHISSDISKSEGGLWTNINAVKNW